MTRHINHDEGVSQFIFKFRTVLSAVQAITQTLKPDREGVSGVRAGLARALSVDGLGTSTRTGFSIAPLGRRGRVRSRRRHRPDINDISATMRTYEDTFSGRKIYPGRVSAHRRPFTRLGGAHWEDRGGI